MTASPFIEVAISPEELAVEQDLAEAAARGDALLAAREAERTARLTARTRPAEAYAFEI